MRDQKSDIERVYYQVTLPVRTGDEQDVLTMLDLQITQLHFLKI